MIDIHSHVLPGIDDGARTMEESVNMLRLAASSGTTDIVATPHSNAKYEFDEVRIHELFLELSDKTRAFITIHLGCDFHLSYKNLFDAARHPQKYTINHTQYLMVELPELVGLSTMRQGLRALIDAAIIPVITHPERNMCVHDKCDELEHWVADGCLLQITGQSFLGSFGPKAKASAEKLLSLGLVHFVASDAHDCVNRPPDLSSAYGHICSHHGAEVADSVCIHNPAAVLAGDSLAWNAPKEQKSNRLFAFWK